ncbi:hypothetical protein HX004_07490 [Myroides sp. 1354]|uniref:hypothetical protein n=1 Tax=unclassified Myroides TaxID=2642485 RepID=UPI002574F90C|nr:MULTISPECIES: hypothetical protein [unclassified Myroides]MDM1044904.1 hypothetical protein [Myroides sp. R163-1]MDM1055617.1 hypothetical protein [Myroides sp. 1354]MDM1068914.1 hypothetical protein [Myroides sp. 1372]
MENQFVNTILKRLFKDVQTLLTIAYLVAVGIGMLFNYKKFILFEINIFDYAGLFDFLIAPFGDFMILLFTIGTMLLTLIIYQVDQFWQKRHPSSYAKWMFNLDPSKWYTKQKLSMGILLFVLYLFLGADVYAKRYKRAIAQQDVIGVIYADNSRTEGILIGKTADYIFLLQGEEVKVIPMNALIKEIKLK